MRQVYSMPRFAQKKIGLNAQIDVAYLARAEVHDSKEGV